MTYSNLHTSTETIKLSAKESSAYARPTFAYWEPVTQTDLGMGWGGTGLDSKKFSYPTFILSLPAKTWSNAYFPENVTRAIVKKIFLDSWSFYAKYAISPFYLSPLYFGTVLFAFIGEVALKQNRTKNYIKSEISQTDEVSIHNKQWNNLQLVNSWHLFWNKEIAV